MQYLLLRFSIDFQKRSYMLVISLLFFLLALSLKKCFCINLEGKLHTSFSNYTLKINFHFLLLSVDQHKSSIRMKILSLIPKNIHKAFSIFALILNTEAFYFRNKNSFFLHSDYYQNLRDFLFIYYNLSVHPIANLGRC